MIPIRYKFQLINFMTMRSLPAWQSTAALFFACDSGISQSCNISSKLHALFNTCSEPCICCRCKECKTGLVIKKVAHLCVRLACACTRQYDHCRGSRTGDYMSCLWANRLQQMSCTMQPSWFWLRINTEHTSWINRWSCFDGNVSFFFVLQMTGA